MEAHVGRRQNKFAQYIMMLTILDHCEKVVQRLGTWVAINCWDQVGLDLDGVRTVVAAADDEDPEEAEGEAEGEAGN